MSKLVCHVFGLLIAVAVCSQGALALDITVVHSGSWPPYAGEDLPEQGLAIDLVTTALKRAGYSPEVETATLSQILEGSMTGAYDVFATPWYTADRDKYLNFSQPYLESSIHFIKRVDTAFEYTEFDDLEGMTIGVVESYAYDEDFNESRFIEKTYSSSLIDNLLKLVAKEIDLSLDDELVLRYALNQSVPDGMTTLEILATPLTTRGVNIGVSRENPNHAKIVADFDKAIAEMKKDGTHDRIVRKHQAYIEDATQH